MDNFSKNDTSINLVTNMNSILQDIFSLKDDFSDDEELKYCFKILLFDDKVFNILSPLLKIYYLREHNISLTLNIKDNREKMSDIMAIYIVTLTKENLDYIFNDIKNQIFDNFYINFISFDTSDNSNKKILDEFYTKTSNLENNSSIYKISIIPIDICLYHPKIFSLNLKRPYLLLNSPNISDDIYQKYLSKISIGLFSALYLMKTYPVVKYHKGFFGDDIIKKIQNEFNYLFKMCPDSKEDFKLKKNSKRTLLLILDRDVDLSIMLHHACSFAAMVNDYFGIGIGGDTTNSKKFNLDPVNDYVWNNKLHEVFVDVGKYVYQEYKNYYKEMDFLDKINKPKDIEQLQNESKQLAKSIETLRDKKLIGNILSQESKIFEELNSIQNSKKLDEIFLMECNILKKKENLNKATKNDFFNLLKNYKDKQDTKEDIYRLCLIYYLCNSKNMTKEEIISIKPYILNKNAMNYITKKIDETNLRENNSMNMGLNNYQRNNSMIMKGLYSAFSTISNLMSIEQPSISADLIDKLIRNQNLANWNTYDFITKNVEKDGGNFSYDNVICFFIGGGSFGEYEYIYDLVNQNGYNVYYGTDYIYRPMEFVQDLEELGKLNNNMNEI